MKYRTLGKTNIKVSEISLGTWQLGSKWGEAFDPDEAQKILRAARDAEINCFDTADVYKDGMSEAAIGEYLQTVDVKPFIITKTGRRLQKQTVEGYSEENIRYFIDDSRRRLKQDSLDMVLLHCPPTDLFYHPEAFQLLDKLKQEQKIKHYGVSVERVEEGLKALEYEGVEAIEIIFNMFRMRPMELFFEEAKKKNVGIIVRVPLASGLLSGKYTLKTEFGKDDHRTNNRNGEHFDKGETFSGVPYEIGVMVADKLKERFGDALPMVALRWILMFDAVSTVIPGASNNAQITANANASELPSLSNVDMDFVETIYNTYIKQYVHQLW